MSSRLIQVRFPSGEGVKLSVAETSSLAELRRKAQEAGAAPFRWLLRGSHGLPDEGPIVLQAGEELTALARRVQVAATGSAFACLRADGSVVAWGDEVGGGDCKYKTSYAMLTSYRQRAGLLQPSGRMGR